MSLSNAARIAEETPAPARPQFEDGKWVWENHYPENISWRAPIETKPLFSLLDDAAKKYANNTLCDFLGKRWSYAQMAKMSDCVAEGLQRLGVTRGTKVGLFLPNTPYSIMFYFGIMKAGGTVVNYNPLYADRELAGQINDSETEIMVTLDQQGLCEKMDRMLSDSNLKKVITCPYAAALPFPKNIVARFRNRGTGGGAQDSRYQDGRFISFADVVDNWGRPAPVSIDVREDVAVLQYTGGTTGIPKGAMLTHENLYANMQQIVNWIGDLKAGKDSIIGVLPMFHVFAMTVVMNVSIHAGLKIILFPKFDLDEVFKAVDKHRPTLFPAVPAVFGAIANAPETENHDFTCLRYCITGGAPMPMDVLRLFEQRTGSPALAEGYGLTESSPGATFNPSQGVKKPGSVGQPVPGTIVEIVSREDGETVLPLGEKGEVCITGPQVMKGYYNKPEATQEVIRSGRLHTGDVGYLDEQGYLHLVDRIKDLIIVRGYNVYPRMVEEAIYLHPAVEECIVAGVPDDERGETVWAWVKPAAGKNVSADALKEFLIDKVSPIEVPRKIILRDTPLPKTAVGKLSRKDLLEQEGITRA
ncbi:MAG: AMP-binding protein [Alphaproteobacteria bacterium]|nr:AMP-binding protein [Alphaproteobacteria bacterium]